MTDHNRGTGKDLLEFWEHVARKGEMNPKHAGNIRYACKKALETLEGSIDVSILDLDVAGAIRRFQNLRSKSVKASTLRQECSNFKRGVELYKSSLENPTSWLSKIHSKNKTPRNDKKITPEDSMAGASSPEKLHPALTPKDDLKTLNSQQAKDQNQTGTPYERIMDTMGSLKTDLSKIKPEHKKIFLEILG